MAIYDFSKVDKSELKTSPLPQSHYAEEEPSAGSELTEEFHRQAAQQRKGHFFSSFAARLFFFLLLMGDFLWAVYALFLFFVSLFGLACSLGKARYFHALKNHAWISFRRSLVCGVSLFLALFSPAFGIMIACTYFLMYDQSGIEEVIPSSLQEQFKELYTEMTSN